MTSVSPAPAYKMSLPAGTTIRRTSIVYGLRWAELPDRWLTSPIVFFSRVDSYHSRSVILDDYACSISRNGDNDDIADSSHEISLPGLLTGAQLPAAPVLYFQPRRLREF